MHNYFVNYWNIKIEYQHASFCISFELLLFPCIFLLHKYLLMFYTRQNTPACMLNSTLIICVIAEAQLIVSFSLAAGLE